MAKHIRVKHKARPEGWTPPSLEDALADPALIALADEVVFIGGTDADPDDPTSDSREHTHARCPRCKMTRPLCVMALWPHGGRKQFLCDGCRTDLMRRGQCKVTALREIGAPETLATALAEAIADPGRIVD